MNESGETPKSDSKKSLAQYQKALKRAEKERQRVQKERELELEKQRRHEEKERQRLQKEREQELERQKKLEEKEIRLREKQAKKEEEERIREEKRKKRLEEQKKREEEKEAERKRKEDEKRKREEERLQKEQEKKEEEALKNKLEEKQRAVLLGFLVKSEQKKPETPAAVLTSSGLFMKFELRKDMRMAPIHRMSESVLNSKRKNLDELLTSWSDSSPIQALSASSLGLHKFGRASYLHELTTRQHVPLSYPSTWPTEPPELLEDELCSTLNSPTLRHHGSRGPGGTVWLRAKLLQFVENYRPAYYGTWRRRSRKVSGRRPFAQDDVQMDYAVDSDDEWEEEEPGESITQSENEEEEEKEEEEDDDDDDQFFVPHGYLSDDEGVAADDVGGEDDEGAEEMKSLRRRLSVAEYEMAHSRGLQRLKPIVVGPVWLVDPLQSTRAVVDELSEDKENVEHFASTEKLGPLGIYSALFVHRAHLWDTTIPIPVHMETIPSAPTRRPKKELPEEALPYLVHLAHKNTLGKPKLAFEFRVFWHRHTTGSLPECTRYVEFKRHNIAAAKANAQRRGPVATAALWDDLALSQNLVLSKLSEVAIFEDGRWSVHADVIRRLRTQLATVCGTTSLLDLAADADDAAFSAVVLPEWQYLTDVISMGKKSNRSSRRRSLESSVLTDSPVIEPPTDPKPDEHPPQCGSPRIVLHPLVLSNDLQDKPELQITSTDYKNQSMIASAADTPSSQAFTDGNLRPEQSHSSIVSRKRGTLESFFCPPTKRPHSNGEGETIVIDSE